MYQIGIGKMSKLQNKSVSKTQGRPSVRTYDDAATPADDSQSHDHRPGRKTRTREVATQRPLWPGRWPNVGGHPVATYRTPFPLEL